MGVKVITEERIAQISNDISENCCTASAKELMQVVQWWQTRCDVWNNLHQKRMGELIEILSHHITEPHP